MEGRATAEGDELLRGRSIVLLQGPSSPFFDHLGQAARALGATVTRIGFAPGDRLFWSRAAGDYLACRVGEKEYPAWIAAYLERALPTDIVMLGDGRFYHREAIRAARAMARPPKVWIVEHGYLRPDRILVEPWGTGGNSWIPERFAQAPEDLGTVSAPPAFPRSFLRYAVYDVMYHFANLLAGPVFYPRRVAHALDGPLREYAGWSLKALTLPVRQYRSRAAWRRIADLRAPVFLLPLQLRTDFQIRDHGTGEPLEQTVAGIIDSFACHAPEAAHLVVTRHPLDNGLTPWRRLIEVNARAAGCAGRVHYIDRGGSAALMTQARGVVTVNSSVGLAALLNGVPCLVMGRAAYAVPGLTFDGPLDMFWTHASPPDRDLAQRFARFLDNRVHVFGSFDGAGSRVGAHGVALRIATGGME